MRIAVCEDDLACLTKLKCLFDQSIGYNANYFATGIEFLKELDGNAYYDIILLDIRLPDILGTKIASQLKQKLPGADVVFISSFPEYVTDAFTLQVSQFLLKPLNEQLLMGELDRIVCRRK